MRNLRNSNSLIWLALVLVMCSLGLVKTMKKVGSIPFTGSVFTTDNLGNVYVVQADNSIEKYNPQGQRLNLSNFKIKGKLHSIDVSNPFEIYLFYKDLNQVIITDNQLSQRGEIDMSKPELVQAAAIARSYDNGLWVFDLTDMQLKKYSKQMELLLQSGNMRSFTDEIVEPIALVDWENKVYLFNPGAVEVFDNFANHLQTIPWNEIDDWQVFGGKIYSSTHGHLSSYDLNTLQNLPVSVPDTLQVGKFRISDGHLFLQQADSIAVFQRRENK